MTSSANNEFLLIFLDRSQQVMTIVGVIANISTSITLIKNGQVGVTLTLIKWPARWHFNSNYNGQVGGTLTLIKWPARWHFNSNYNGQVGGTLTLIIMDR